MITVIKLLFIYILCNLVIYILNVFEKEKSLKNIKENYLNMATNNITKFKFSKILDSLLIEFRRCILNEDITSFNSKNLKYKIMFFILSIIFSICSAFLSFKLFGIVSSSCIIFCFCFFIPFFLLKYIIYYYKQKVKDEFLSYIISLKNYINTNNDIVQAMKNIKADKYMKKYIDSFNLKVNNGLNVSYCFDKLIEEINIESIGKIFKFLNFCYIEGGDFSILLEKYIKMYIYNKEQKQRQIQEQYSTKIVIIILILINIYMTYSFVFANYEYKQIITTTFFGKFVFNINILSYIFIFLLNLKLNRMEA